MRHYFILEYSAKSLEASGLDRPQPPINSSCSINTRSSSCWDQKESAEWQIQPQVVLTTVLSLFLPQSTFRQARAASALTWQLSSFPELRWKFTLFSILTWPDLWWIKADKRPLWRRGWWPGYSHALSRGHLTRATCGNCLVPFMAFSTSVVLSHPHSAL